VLTNSRFFPFPCFPLFSPRPLNASSTRRPSTAYSERYILHPRPAALIPSTASPSLPQLRIPTFIRAQCPCVPLVRIHPITIRFGTHVFPGTIYVPPPEMGADRWSPHHSLHVAVLPIRDDPEPDREDPSTLANEIDAYETPVSLYLHHLTPRIPSF